MIQLEDEEFDAVGGGTGDWQQYEDPDVEAFIQWTMRNLVYPYN